jgi:hypothetical protein
MLHLSTLRHVHKQGILARTYSQIMYLVCAPDLFVHKHGFHAATHRYAERLRRAGETSIVFFLHTYLLRATLQEKKKNKIPTSL